MRRFLMKGNDAIGEGAILAGCRHFFGYPITPQSEVTHYLAKRLPEVGGLFMQAESELASINLVFGAASAGARVMTASSSPGVSLMQEGLSFLAGSELPCVLVNIMRGGPGLGNIGPSQADYFQATRGGGHGDYYTIVLAPNSVQEILDLMKKAFDLSDKYRMTAMVLADGIMGQMMEPVVIDEEKSVEIPPRPWATIGRDYHEERNVINSLYIVLEEMEEVNFRLLHKYEEIRAKETLCEEYMLDDAEVALVAFGTVSRICRAVVDKARDQGIRAGLIRPITLWPFPYDVISRAAKSVQCFLAVEMNMGQMFEDVEIGAKGRVPVYHYGRLGGMVPLAKDILEELKKVSERGGTGR